MNQLFFILLVFLGFLNKGPEPKVKVRGHVQDNRSKEHLSSVHIVFKNLDNGLQYETRTNPDGFFSITLSNGRFSYSCEAEGYSKSRSALTVRQIRDTTLNMGALLLKPLNDTLRLRTGSKEETVPKAEPLYYSKGKKSHDVPETESARGTLFHHSYGAAVVADYPSEYTGVKTSWRSGGMSAGAEDRAMYRNHNSTGLKAGTLTAGEINDFSKWVLWNDLNSGTLKEYVNHWGILPKHRFCVMVSNPQHNPVADVRVVLKDPAGNPVWESRTDNTGKAELWAGLLDSNGLKQGHYSMDAYCGGIRYSIEKAKLFYSGINTLTVQADCRMPETVDIVFAVDATGSMGDEIYYLQTELADVMESVKNNNPALRVRMGSVFYRDVTDAYLTVQSDLDSSLDKTLNFMRRQTADGGGDEPEAVDAALDVAISKFSWSEQARSRIVFLVLDASPHQDPETRARLFKSLQMAAQKGIKIIPVVCSGIDKSAEYLMRSMALATNGNYLFLTDHSGIGNTHLEPSTDTYKVETLNRLLIRIIQQYVYAPACDESAHAGTELPILSDTVVSRDDFVHPSDSSTHVASDSATKPDTGFLRYYPNPCRGQLTLAFSKEVTEVYVCDLNGKILLKPDLFPEQGRIEVDLSMFTDGIYYIHYLINGVRKSGKFVLIR